MQWLVIIKTNSSFNNVKKFIFTVLIFLASATVVSAAYNDVILTTDTIISVGGYSLNVYSSSATIESVTVGADSFSAVLQSGSSIVVSSSAGKTLSYTADKAVTESKTCSGGVSTLTLTYNSNAQAATTVTVTPSSTACTASASTATSVAANGPVSGGGGGGGGYTPVTKVVSNSPTPTPVVTPIVSAPVLPSAIFTTVLVKGSENSDVIRLQQLLASDKEIYPLGKITGYFGPATEQAVKNFQLKYGVIKNATESGAGRVGPATRAKLAEVFGGVKSVVPAATLPIPTVSNQSLTRDLYQGISGNDVKFVQQILNRDPDTIVSESGSGSSGNESVYFGAMTRKAVEKFQVKYNLTGPGKAGYGRVGPMTRAKLLEVSQGQ